MPLFSCQLSRFLFFPFVSILLSGCASSLSGVIETLADVVYPDRKVSEKRLDPGFRYLRIQVNGRLAFLARGAIDDLKSQPLEVSRRSIVGTPKPSNLIGIAPESLTWFEETTEGSAYGNARSIYAIRRGTNGSEVVYSEQCIAPDLCFTVQLWGSTGPR